MQKDTLKATINVIFTEASNITYVLFSSWSE